MDKTAIKSFAINSRNKLMQDVRDQMYMLGITENGIADSITNTKGIQTFQISSSETHSIYNNDIKKRESLVREVKAKGFENVVEEVAYTWFNRIIAIRFMEVNNYLPTKTRVLSSESPNKIEPDMVTEAFDLDLDYSQEDREYIFKLKDENDEDNLFRFLFIKQCNKLNEILPGLFEKTEDYMELLLKISYTEGSLIFDLINSISEDDFKEDVEIIGWLYQYYNASRKKEVIDTQKGKIIKKEDIPAATQIFTPKWIVQYMVDNSLGRYWVERNKNSNLKNYLKFYLNEPIQTDKISSKLMNIRDESLIPESMKFLDPCMGSGHILLYAFDVFIEIYKELGYFERDIPKLILENNLYGLDIDDRAYQLAYFALMMKARSYDMKILQKNVILNVYPIQESKGISINSLDLIKNFDKQLYNNVNYLIDIFYSAKEFGSLIQIKDLNFEEMECQLNKIITNCKSTLLDELIIDEINKKIFPLLKQAKILSYKYEAVVTNPPYMSRFEKSFKDFAKEHYKDYSKDLFSMFIYRNFDFCVDNGYSGLMTPYGWMFIKNFEKLREYIFNNKSISSLIQLEKSSFKEATVSIATFVFLNKNFDGEYKTNYLKLSNFKGDMDVQKNKVLDAINNKVNYLYISDTKNFCKIPSYPLAFWLSNFEVFKYPNLKTSFVSGGRNKTHNNKKYVRKWWEISKNSKWELYSNGGDAKKWYGGVLEVVDWSEEGKLEYKSHGGLYNEKFWYKEGLCWNLVSYSPSFRIKPSSMHYSSATPTLFNETFTLNHQVLGFLNSSVSLYLMQLLNPTNNTTVNNVLNLPFKYDEDKLISTKVSENINISKDNWDSYEISYDFRIHPFLKYNLHNLNEICENVIKFSNSQFVTLKNNEEFINKYFINEYGLINILDYTINEKDITLKSFDKISLVKSFISYFVGCLFGRYDLEKEGLVCDNSSFNLENYSKFVPDDDNIIPVLDTEYFEDDIVGRFVEFVKVCFGEENLEENLEFIAKSLNDKNKSSREIIREYFFKKFFDEHCKIYKKCPIYWMFSSGKQNGFNCLVYMHRYTPDLVARVRTDYLHKTQKAIEERIIQCDNIIESNSPNTEKKKATKDKIKLEKQLKETRDYDDALEIIANQKIEIDLDDGVKVNYAKFQNVEITKEGNNSKNMNLLKKIKE